MGATLGFCCVIRYTSVAFATVPVVFGIQVLRETAPGRRKAAIGCLLLSLAGAVCGSLVGFLPQLLAWKAVYGSWAVYSYRGEELSWLPRNAHLVLFGSRNGLFTWTPVALAAVAGLILLARRGHALAQGGLASLVALTWIYGGWHCYWLGDSFGMRGFVDASVFLILGLAEVIAWAWRSRFTRVAAPATGILLVVAVAWNICFATCYRADIQPHGAAFAGAGLFSQPKEWAKQFKKDWRPIRRVRGGVFPLFTPADAAAGGDQGRSLP
jgi:hypothetical protein